MKRLSRQAEKFDALELYSAVSRKQGYKIGVVRDLQDFHSRIGVSLKASLDNPAILYGKRVEAMFAHVLGALGSCSLIKQEDAGTIFADSADIRIPDYRIVTEAGDIILIEVKNFHMKSLDSRLYLQRSYLKKLRAYADMNGASLKIAVYFSRINKWVLLSPEAFVDAGRRVYIDLSFAMAKNELALLGDRMIATLPPLSIEFLGDPHDERAIVKEDGSAVFTIRELSMKCGGNTIVAEIEKNIAFYLMRYGSWKEAEMPARIVNGRLVAFEVVFAPDEPVDEQPFQILGHLSSMISNAFRELTSGDTGVVSLDVKHDPMSFQVDIPKKYRGSAMPLWQFVIQPNSNFRP
jgi:Holliday junction resolvase